MNNYANRTKLVKKALLERYNYKDISVKRGRGTACGWVEVKVLLDMPVGCECLFETYRSNWSGKEHAWVARKEIPNTRNHTGFNSYYCDKCTAILEVEKEKARELVYKSGAEFGTYYVDDGYGSESSEVLIDVDIRTPEPESVRECKTCGDKLQTDDDLVCGYHHLEI